VTTARAPLLSARDLHVRFPRAGGGEPRRPVDGVDLDLAEGEILALAGESGSGKTTLIRTLLGLLRPVAGEVRYGGEALRYAGPELSRYRRHVQLVPQDPTGALNPRLPVYDAVAEGVRIQRPDRATGPRRLTRPGRSRRYRGAERRHERDRVARALEQVGLRPAERFFWTYPRELSGGQRQRVVIAGALVVGPRVLLADEPVSSVDAAVRGEILALFLRLRDELGVSALIATHDLGVAWQVADRLAVMHRGRIVEAGSVESVLGAPRHPHSRALVSAALTRRLPDPADPDIPAGPAEPG
jgi:peptide/nickel transport system ATP-binding protein